MAKMPAMENIWPKQVCSQRWLRGQGVERRNAVPRYLGCCRAHGLLIGPAGMEIDKNYSTLIQIQETHLKQIVFLNIVMMDHGYWRLQKRVDRHLQWPIPLIFKEWKRNSLNKWFGLPRNHKERILTIKNSNIS